MISGNGYFIWQLGRLGNLETVAKKLASAGVEWVAIKMTNGYVKFGYDLDHPSIDLVPNAVAIFRAAGLKVFGWGYVYGSYMGQDGNMVASAEAEATVAVERIKQFGLDTWIIDAESEYKGKNSLAALYVSTLKTRAQGVDLALCSFRWPDYHPEFPWKEFLAVCDINMPQVYWEQQQNSASQLDTSIAQFTALYKTLGLTRIPEYVPVGATYQEHGWQPTVASIEAFARRCVELNLSAYCWWEIYYALALYPDMFSAATCVSSLNVSSSSNEDGGENSEGQNDNNVTGENEMSSVWSAMARGFGLQPGQLITDASKISGDSFGVVPGLNEDGTININAGTQIGQVREQCGLPAFLLFNISADPYIELGPESQFETADRDYHMKLLDRLVYWTDVAGAKHKRDIAGIIFDGRNPVASDGRRTTQTNWVRALNFVINTAKERYGIRRYMILSMDMLTKWPADNGRPLETWATQTGAHASVREASGLTGSLWGSWPVPEKMIIEEKTVDWKPDYVGDVPYSFFTWYGQAAPGEGISGGGKVDLWQYYSTREKLASDIGFTFGEVASAPADDPMDDGQVIDDPVGDQDNIPVTGNLTETNVLLAEIRDILKDVYKR